METFSLTFLHSVQRNFPALPVELFPFKTGTNTRLFLATSAKEQTMEIAPSGLRAQLVE